MTRLISCFCVLAALHGIRAPLNTLVDKDHGLPAEYAPGPHPLAELAMEDMIEAAEGDGVLIKVVGGYRPYDVQARLYAEDASNRAAPGHSEHQLGTAFDVAWPGKTVYWIGQNEVVWGWLAENAAQFGFVISYPYKQCDIWPYDNAFMGACGVQYKHEGWHVRYVGRRLAGEIFQAGYLDPMTPVVPQDFYRAFPDWLACYHESGMGDREGVCPKVPPPRRWPTGRWTPGWAGG